MINDCINIENNLKDINIINDKIKKYEQTNKINYKFNADFDNLLDKIKNFGFLSDSLILKNSKQN